MIDATDKGVAWTADDAENPTRIAAGHPENTICYLQHKGFDRLQSERVNIARLIVAAPSMRDLLRQAVENGIGLDWVRATEACLSTLNPKT